MKEKEPFRPLRAKPLLIVLSGPSGVGKDVVLARMKELGYPLHYTMTATTRPQREGESDGADYHFISPARFEEMVKRGELLEWAKVYGNRYGVPKHQVEEALGRGLDVIVKADVQGAATIKGVVPQALLIFLAPPSMEQLEERLRQRKTESTIDLNLRIETAREEMKCLPMFDYVVVNRQDRPDLAVAQIDAIITAEKCRVTQTEVEI
ncbi:MAG: guanylate kinase [Dehalococcoidia bacterium]|nr:MAG: guanylate kinase [Dehalococcoidia bacterium]